jgi:hypothetical protein
MHKFRPSVAFPLFTFVSTRDDLAFTWSAQPRMIRLIGSVDWPGSPSVAEGQWVGIKRDLFDGSSRLSSHSRNSTPVV